MDAPATGADAYTVSAHKWLLAPTGSGLLYLRNDSAAARGGWFAPTYLDGGPSGYTQATGTVPLQSVAGLGYALDFFDALGGAAAAEAHNMALREVAYDRLAQLVDALLLSGASGASGGKKNYTGLALLSPPGDSGVASPIVSLNLPPAMLEQRPASRPVSDWRRREASAGPRRRPFFVENAIRVFHHVFNDEADVAKLLNQLPQRASASRPRSTSTARVGAGAGTEVEEEEAQRW